MSERERIAFVINPISGVGKQKDIEAQVGRYLDHTKYEQTIFYTSYAHHAVQLAEEILNDGFPNLVIVGGDGSINDCIQSIVGTKIRVGIIPLGSGNGLARHLRIPLKIRDAIRVINRQKMLPIDTVKINSRIYASIAGIGFDAEVAREFALSRLRGFQTYFRITLKSYAAYEPSEYHLIIDGNPISSKALFISFANSNQFGYNTEIAPQAKLDDGFLDVCIVKKVPFALIPWTAQLLFTKHFEKSIYVQTIRAKKVQVLNNPSGFVNLDGEPVYMGDSLHLEILPHSLNVMIP